jgi:hypothetical protein
MKELIDNNEAHFADAGGFVSPLGISYVGASKEKLGEAACCAVKRINLDNRVAKAAKRVGAGGWSGLQWGGAGGPGRWIGTAIERPGHGPACVRHHIRLGTHAGALAAAVPSLCAA